jgi:hypothetical protein
VLGNLSRHASRVLLHFYDLVIVVPLMIEHLVKSARTGKAAEKPHPRSARGEA